MMKTGDPGGRRAMTVGAMLVLVGVLVVYLMLGLWAVTQIFPRDPASPSRPTPTGGSSGTARGERNVTGPQKISPGSERP